MIKPWMLRGVVAVLSTGLLTTGCSDNPVDEGGEPTLRLVSGAGQRALQGDLLPEPLILQVTDSNTQGVPGVAVLVQVSEGGGQIENADVRTDAEGKAVFEWRLGEEWHQAVRISLAEGMGQPLTASANATYRYERPLAVTDGWPTSSVDLHGPNTPQLLGAVDEIRAGVYPEVHSLLVVQGGSLVLEAYFPGHDSQGQLIAFSRTTPHEAQSATKSFRSAMMGIAIDQGYVSGVDQALYTFFPEYEALFTGTKRDITVEDVLTMSTGLDWNEWLSFDDPANTLREMYSLPAPQWAEYVLSRPMRYTPGSQFVYNTGASIMLNRMIMNASGMPMLNFVHQHYSTRVESTGAPGIGYPLGASILPRDMAKLGQVFLDDGLWKGARVVSSSWVQQSTQARFQVNAGTGYGYQWWTRTYATSAGSYDAFYAAGNGGQYIIVVDALDLVIVFTGGNFGSAQAEQAHTLVERHVIPGLVSG